MIPVWIKVRVLEKGGKKTKFSFPLIIGWVFLFALLIAVSPLVIVLGIITWPFGYGKTIIFSYLMIFALIFSLSGLMVEVDTEDKEKKTYIKIV
jgi:hypothetical protein